MKRNASLPGGEDQFLTSDCLSLWYKVAGRGPVLLVPTPGWGASVDMYMKSLIPLEKDYCLIYLDTRGAGRSEAPAKTSGFAFSHFLGDLETLRLHLGLDEWLIFAHSDAGSQAMAYGIEYPEACRGLFIVGGTPNIQDKEYKTDLRARMKKLEREPWFAAADKASRAKPRSNVEFKQSFLCAQLPMYFASYDATLEARHYFSASTYRVIGNKYHPPKFPPEKLAQIGVPTALFEGEHDVITTPLDADRLHNGIAHSTLSTIENAGHFPWLEQRDRFFEDFAQAAQRILDVRR